MKKQSIIIDDINSVTAFHEEQPTEDGKPNRFVFALLRKCETDFEYWAKFEADSASAN